MNYKRFLEISRDYWNKYFLMLANASSSGFIDSNGRKNLFPSILLFTKTKHHYVLELLGANERYVGLTEKSHREISINRYLNQFDTNAGHPLICFDNKGLSRVKDICLSRQADFEKLKVRFPFVDTSSWSVLVPPENTTGSLVSFGKNFESVVFEHCTLINTNLTFFRVKSILTMFVVQDSMLASSYELNLKNYLYGDNTVKGIHTCDFGKAQDLTLASQFANTYLFNGLRETTIGEFLNTHSEIINRSFKTRKYVYEPHLLWKEAHPANNDTAINPDLMVERDDGFYDIYDLKTALLNKPSITKGERNRRRFIDYVEEGVAQLANYLEYFDYSKNCHFAYEKYGVKIKNPNLVLVVGNFENANKTEIQEASRRLKNLTIIDYDSFLQLFLLSSM